MSASGILNNEDTILKKEQIQTHVDNYEKLYSDNATVETRQSNYMTMVNNLYDLVTDFYEYGWGTSFHFAQRFSDETFHESIVRAEYLLALHLQLNRNSRVIDLGCGVGGPMRNIARFSGSQIVGVNNNDYQIKKGEKHNQSMGLSGQCKFLKADFMNLPIDKDSFDAAYAIEATCHAPNKTACFAEIYRVLKPGALFAVYEWCLTPYFDPSNAEHQKIKKGIEVGNGLPDIETQEMVLEAYRKAGFEIVYYSDVHADAKEQGQTPWYQPLSGSLSITGFRHTRIGRWCTHKMVSMLERCRIAPKGTVRVHEILMETAKDLSRSGELGIFTPDFLVVGRKPLK
eukprot:TRINITY_DN1079_c0_g1_i1.p1 TRINITY_DN1079_c0_g1~~TRINITY_DN1079_c0_g1_i1.p1  ORF type:complete len:343 (+),score=181.93 TRINITY_DN1079_c0_g1_i1:221-1249(+)